MGAESKLPIAPAAIEARHARVALELELLAELRSDAAVMRRELRQLALVARGKPRDREARAARIAREGPDGTQDVGGTDADSPACTKSIRCIIIIKLPMATTVRIDDRTKQWLEHIRAELTLRTGKRHSLEEVLRLLTGRALERKSALFEELADRPPEVPPAEWRRIFALPRRWGGSRVRPQDIDDVVTEDAGR